MGRSFDEWKIGDPMINERDYWQDPNYVPEDPEKEKLVKKLAEMITDRVKKKLLHKINDRDPEYWILDMILNKEQVKFLLNFKKTRVPYSVPELAEMNGMSVEDTQKMVERLRWIGVIEQNRAKTPDKHLQYELPIFVPGSAEFMMMQDRLTDEFPQLATFFNLMTQIPLAGLTQLVPPGGAGIGMHVIPVEKAISTESKSVPVEHISRWLDMYDKYGISECSCRKQQTMRGEVPSASEKKKKSKWSISFSKVRSTSARVSISPLSTERTSTSFVRTSCSTTTAVQEKNASVAAATAANIIIFFISFISLDY